MKFFLLRQVNQEVRAVGKNTHPISLSLWPVNEPKSGTMLDNYIFPLP